MRTSILVTRRAARNQALRLQKIVRLNIPVVSKLVYKMVLNA